MYDRCERFAGQRSTSVLENHYLSRRVFLKTLTVAGAAVALAPIAGEQEAHAAGSFESVGKLDDFSEGDYKKVTLSDGHSAFVTRQGGTVRVLSTKCTHKGCDVLWVPSHHTFQCPCHGGIFDSKGAVVSGPPKSPLPEMASKVENGIVYVHD